MKTITILLTFISSIILASCATQPLHEDLIMDRQEKMHKEFLKTAKGRKWVTNRKQELLTGGVWEDWKSFERMDYNVYRRKWLRLHRRDIKRMNPVDRQYMEELSGPELLWKHWKKGIRPNPAYYRIPNFRPKGMVYRMSKAGRGRQPVMYCENGGCYTIREGRWIRPWTTKEIVRKRKLARQKRENYNKLMEKRAARKRGHYKKNGESRWNVTDRNGKRYRKRK